MIKGLEFLSFQRLRGQDCSCWRRWDSIFVYKYLLNKKRKKTGGLFSVVSRERTRSSRPKLKYKIFPLNFNPPTPFTVRVVKHWIR